MCFDRFLLAFESRDLSQANKSITRVFFFPKLQFLNDKLQLCPKNLFSNIWQNCFGHFITQKFVSLKSNQFSQFFLVRGIAERIDKINVQKVQASDLRDRKRSSTTHHLVWERRHSYNTFVSLR